MQTVASAKIPHSDVHQSVQETLTTLGPGVVYSRLLRVRTGADVAQPSLSLECDLCESWELVDPTSYRFHLRPGIRWQNIPPVNGRELTAMDVACSYERLSGRKLTGENVSCGFDVPFPAEAPNAFLLADVQSIDVEDDRTLTLNINPAFPNADFLLSLADGHAKIVAPEAVNVLGDLQQGPAIGTGPWVLKSAQVDTGSVFERNSDYFEEGLPFLDEFVSRVIKADDAALAAFLVNEVQVYRISPQQWQEVTEAGQQIPSVVVGQGGTGLVLAMNVSRSPFDDPLVRQALLKALDPWDYVDTIWAGQGYASLGIPVVESDWLLTRDEMRSSYFADQAAARRILTELDPPRNLEFDLQVGEFSPLHKAQGERLQQDLQTAGFSPKLVLLSPAQYAETVVRDRRYQVSLGVLPPTSGTTNFLLAALHSRGQWNLTAHDDDTLDQMIEAQAVEMAPAARGEQIKEIERYLLDQAYLFSPVTGATRWAMAPQVRGFYPTPAASEYFYWAKTWLQP